MKVTPALLSEVGGCAVNEIEELNLKQRGIDDVDAIAGIACLKKLNLNQNSLTSLEAFCGPSLPDLSWLSVSENSLESMKGVEQLTRLTGTNYPYAYHG